MYSRVTYKVSPTYIGCMYSSTPINAGRETLQPVRYVPCIVLLIVLPDLSFGVVGLECLTCRLNG